MPSSFSSSAAWSGSSSASSIFVGDAVVEIEPRDAELLAAVLVDQLDGGAVLLRALEVVARDVVAEDALRQLVVLEQRRAGEADERGVRQRQAHVAREPAGLRAVRLVRDHDDVVALAVGLFGSTSWLNLWIRLKT